MRTVNLPKKLLLVGILSLGLGGCGQSNGEGTGTGGMTSSTGGSGGTSSSAGGTVAGGTTGTGGSVASGGGSTGSGGAQGTGGARPGTGGRSTGTGGRAGTGGATGMGPGGSSGGSSGGCVAGAFPTSDPATTGPFATTTDNNVGPSSGYTMFRPSDLAQGGLCHPVITWGNGHGTTPSLYSRFLTHLASHGFVVIASNSSTVSQGTPPPMLDGVTWVLAQNDDPASVLYQRIDTAHVGATGHSEGAMATMTAGADARVVTIAPIEGASASNKLHGPAAFFCGGQDTTLPCSRHMTAFEGVTNQPVMYANQLAASHTNWMMGGGTTLNPFMVATTGWMRVHLMGDTALRPMFYGATCTLCEDTATWEIARKMMD